MLFCLFRADRKTSFGMSCLPMHSCFRALQFRIPMVSGVSHDSSLITYAPDTDDLFRRAATYVDKILRGASPPELPVQLPTKFLLEINLKNAKALNLKIPQCLLAQADEVIE